MVGRGSRGTRSGFGSPIMLHGFPSLSVIADVLTRLAESLAEGYTVRRELVLARP
jgi:hypothetical protein